MTKQKSNRESLYLIDGYAMLYRAHFAFIRNPLMTSYGLPTSALFGFSNQILNLVKKENPDYIAAVFDTAKKTFRHEMYPEYKATREKMPDELKEQLPHLWDILNALQITTLSKVGFEADDIIGTLAKWGAEHELDVYIVSGDKDFMQLINDHVFMYSTVGRNMETQIIDRKGVIDKWGVPPEKIIDLMGLMGDSSDNIPGVMGVGKVSAKKLILEYGTLEASLDNAEKVGNKRVREGLLNNRDNAFLSKELVTIDINVKLDSNIDELKRNEFDIDALSDLFQQFEFSGLMKQLPDFQIDTVPSLEEPTKDYITINNIEELKLFINGIESSKMLSIDLETTSVDPMLAEIVGLSFSAEKDNGFYIPIQYKDKSKNNFGDDELQSVLSLLKPIYENGNITKIGQNIKYDSLILKRHGIDVNGIGFDTMLAAHIVSPETRSYKIDNLSLEYLNYRMMPIEELIGKGKNQTTMAEVELAHASFYATEDADIALQLYNILNEKLISSGLDNYYREVELPLINVLIEMEKEGLKKKKKILKSMSEIRSIGNRYLQRSGNGIQY